MRIKNNNDTTKSSKSDTTKRSRIYRYNQKDKTSSEVDEDDNEPEGAGVREGPDPFTILISIEDITPKGDLKEFIRNKLSKVAEKYKIRYGVSFQVRAEKYTIYEIDAMTAEFNRAVAEATAVIWRSPETFFIFLEILEELQNNEELLSLYVEHIKPSVLRKIKFIEYKTKLFYKVMWPDKSKIPYKFTMFDQKSMSDLIDRLLNSKNEKISSVIAGAISFSAVDFDQAALQSYDSSDFLISEESMRKLIEFLDKNINTPHKPAGYIHRLIRFTAYSYMLVYDIVVDFIIRIIENKENFWIDRNSLIYSLTGNRKRLENKKIVDFLKKIAREWKEEPEFQVRAYEGLLEKVPEEVFDEAVILYNNLSDKMLKRNLFDAFSRVDHKIVFNFNKEILLSPSHKLHQKSIIISNFIYNYSILPDAYKSTAEDYEKLFIEITNMEGKVSDKLRGMAYYALFHFHFPLNRQKWGRDKNFMEKEIDWNFNTLIKMRKDKSEFVRDVAKETEKLVTFLLQTFEERPSYMGEKRILKDWESPFDKISEEE